MTYVKQNWVDGSSGGTPVSATRLLYMEEGIYEASVAAGAGSSSDLRLTSRAPLQQPTGAGIQPGVTLTDTSTTTPPTGITWDGSEYRINSPGVYQALNFVGGPVTVRSDDVVLLNCKFDAGATDYSVPALSLSPNDNFALAAWRRRIVDHCEFTGTWGSGVYVAGGTVRNCYFHDTKSDGINPGRSVEPTIIEGNVMKDFNPSGGSHVDGIQIVEVPAGPIVIQGNWIAAENKSGRPYNTTNPQTGYTSAMFVECGIAPDGSDLFPGLIGSVVIKGNYFSANESYITIKIKPRGVPVEFSENIVRQPLDSNQQGITGATFDLDTQYQGRANVDAVTGLPVTFKLFDGPSSTKIVTSRSKLLHADQVETWAADDCAATQAAATGTAYVAVVRLTEDVRGKAMRCWVDVAGTVTAANVAVYVGGRYNFLPRAGINLTPTLTAGLAENLLTVPTSTANPLGTGDSSGDVVGYAGDLMAFVITTTNSVSPTFLSKQSFSAAFLNRGSVLVAASKAIAPGALPTSLDLTSGWTGTDRVIWASLVRPYPQT